MDVCFRLNNLEDEGGWGSKMLLFPIVSVSQKLNKIAMQFFLFSNVRMHSFYKHKTFVWVFISMPLVPLMQLIIHSWIRACSSHTSPDPTRLRMKTWKCCNSINIYPSPINKHDCPPLIPEGVKHKYWVTLQWMYYWRHDTTTSTEVLDDQSSCSDASQVSQPHRHEVNKR